MSRIHFSGKCNYCILLHNKTPIHSTWGLLRVCATCPTPRLNQSYELRSPWEQHLRYVPHRVRNGYNTIYEQQVLPFDLQVLCQIFESRKEFEKVLKPIITWGEWGGGGVVRFYRTCRSRAYCIYCTSTQNTASYYHKILILSLNQTVTKEAFLNILYLRHICQIPALCNRIFYHLNWISVENGKPTQGFT